MPNPVIDTSSTTLSTFVRNFRPDETVEPWFGPKPNLKTRRNDGDPITNTRVTTKTVSVSTFGTNTEQYGIHQDFESYKGQQFEHLFQQYMGGETYGFALVLVDRKGAFSFATHLSDYTFPQQYEKIGSDDFTLTKKINTFQYNLNIKGLKINNLKIPKACLFDKFGKLNVSGFMIVRTDRKGEVLHQGIVVPVVENTINDGEDIQVNKLIKPHPILSNKFELPYVQGGDLGKNHLHDEEYYGNPTVMVREEASTRYNHLNSVAGYCMYYSPDVMIEESHEFKEVDRIKHVGTCYKAYTKDVIPLWGSREIPVNINGESTYEINKHFYSKNYNTDITRVNGDPQLSGQYGRPRVGEESRLKFSHLIPQHDTKLEEFDKDDLEMTFKNGDIWALHPVDSDFTDTNPNTFYKRGNGLGARNSLLLGMLDFDHIDIWDAQSTSAYRIVNYLRTNSDYITPNGENGFDVRQYKFTGHYQPIDTEILSQADEDDDNFIFNNIEVWGGDSYVNLFDFTRIVPQGSRTCENENRSARLSGGSGIDYRNGNLFYKEYATSMVVPLESKYNLALRYGRHFAANATNPQLSYCENVDLHFSQGIMSLQPESFSINRVLLFQENIQFFETKPQGIKLVSNKDNSIYYSQTKTYSEEVDSYRRQLPTDFLDIPGSSGKITGMVEMFNYIYLIQERGFGVLRTRERAVVVTNVGQVTMGTGGALDAIDYISKENGTIHPRSVVVGNNALYFWDANNGVIIRHSQAGRDELSDSNLLHDFTQTKSDVLKLAGSVISYIDRRNGDVCFGIKTQKENVTLKFNKTLSAFHGDHDGVADIFLYDDKWVMCPDPQDPSVLHRMGDGRYGEIFGVFYPTKLRFVVNPVPSYSKVFDNMNINVNPLGQKRIHKIKLTTPTGIQELEYQNLNVILDERFKYKENILHFPLREKVIGIERVRGKYMIVDIEIQNDLQAADEVSDSVVISAIETIYRMSNRI